ncbi:NAD(P)/FAD-dependent oxidoreductase, partial [Oscillospiraceae bacterium OttesenSCG-928-G22]|nr:NAD(P)/FAD-dependent oxidoreductase [Oscillospiraceae bacterium OttesenSCG-928-G22]
GLSGPPVLQLTALYPDSYPYVVSLDLMPEFQEGDVLALLRRRREELSHLDMTAFFSGLFHKRVGNVIAKRSGVERLSLPIRDLGDEHLTRMAEVVKSFQFTATAPQGFSQAQVTVGGADTDEFDEKTMESKKVPGLYVSGELYDIHGDCGGYNLQWAWASGYLAGTSAALSLANAAPKLEERL